MNEISLSLTINKNEPENTAKRFEYTCCLRGSLPHQITKVPLEIKSRESARTQPHL